MIRLNLGDLAVNSFSPLPEDDGADELMLTNTDPRACPRTQGWDCNSTDAVDCETGGGAAC